jgi:hypothetical protein
MVNSLMNISVATPIDALIAQELCHLVKRDMALYKELKEDKHFNS